MATGQIIAGPRLAVEFIAKTIGARKNANDNQYRIRCDKIDPDLDIVFIFDDEYKMQLSPADYIVEVRRIWKLVTETLFSKIIKTYLQCQQLGGG